MKVTAILLFFLVVLGVTLPFIRSAEREVLTAERRARAPGKFVRLSQGWVNYEVAGPESGQPVLLVPGFTVPMYIWEPTFTGLAQAGFRVIRYDLYGRGFSDRPQVTYDRALFERQILELLAALRIAPPVDLIGVSVGGAIAGAFTASHSRRVRRLVLIDPYALPQSIWPLNLPGIGEYLNCVYLVPSLPERQMADFYAPARFPGWADRYRDQMRYRGFAAAVLSSLRHFFTQKAISYYRNIDRQKHAVMLIWGQEDRTIPFSQSRIVLEALGPAEFVPVSQAGHLPHYEAPEIVNPKIIKFLRAR